MTAYQLIEKTAKNAGDAREWSVCNHFGQERTAHDAKAYDVASDCETADHGYSVKASAFTLMSGNLCEGKTDFEDIWNLFASRVHSDRFIYVTTAWVGYEMNLTEFCEFVHTFCFCERESAKNGGATKIRCRKESSKMIRWLEERVA